MEIQEVTAIKHSLKPYTNADLVSKREELGFSTKDFARLFGVSRTMLYRMEQNPTEQLDFQFAATLRYLVMYFRTEYTGADLRAQRESIGFTTVDFADLLCISRTTLFRIESEPNRKLGFHTTVALRYLINYFQT